MNKPTSIRVELAYSPAARVVEFEALELPVGSRVTDALAGSTLVARHHLDTATLTFSVWGRRCASTDTLEDGDRVECCRPLSVDPKEARRQRYKGQGGKKRVASGRPVGAAAPSA